MRPLTASPGLAIYLAPRMLLLAWLGLVSGLPLALTASTLTAWLADSGLSIKTIGLFALVGVPYTFKFVWAPLMDGLSPPLGKQLGRRRAWMVWWLLALALCIFATSTMAVTDLYAIALLTLALAFSSASFDINLDALRIDWLPAEEQGAGAAMAVLGYRIGMIVSSAGALYLAAFESWQLAYQVMAGVVLLGLVPVLLARGFVGSVGSVVAMRDEKMKDEQMAQSIHPSSSHLSSYFIEPFRQFTLHPGWWLILIFILLFKLGDAVLGFMTMPFLIDAAGYAKQDIALVVKIYGLLASIVGGLLGGWLVMRLGIFRSLLLGGILQSVANLPYAYLAFLPAPDLTALGATIAIDNAFGGFATTAFIAYISGLCGKQFSATQYALLNSLASVGRIFISASSGAMAAAMGWPLFFVFTAVLGLPGLLLLVVLRKRFAGADRG